MANERPGHTHATLSSETVTMRGHFELHLTSKFKNRQSALVNRGQIMLPIRTHA